MFSSSNKPFLKKAPENNIYYLWRYTADRSCSKSNIFKEIQKTKSQEAVQFLTIRQLEDSSKYFKIMDQVTMEMQLCSSIHIFWSIEWQKIQDHKIEFNADNQYFYAKRVL